MELRRELWADDKDFEVISNGGLGNSPANQMITSSFISWKSILPILGMWSDDLGGIQFAHQLLLDPHVSWTYIFIPRLQHLLIIYPRIFSTLTYTFEEPYTKRLVLQPSASRLCLTNPPCWKKQLLWLNSRGAALWNLPETLSTHVLPARREYF